MGQVVGIALGKELVMMSFDDQLRLIRIGLTDIRARVQKLEADAKQGQQQILSDIATGAAFECSGDRDCLAKDHEDDCQYDPGYEAIRTARPMALRRAMCPRSAPEIPESWDLITAGDGQACFRRDPTSGMWSPLCGGEGYSAAEITALFGQVCRAVVVTLPDLADVMPADLGLDAAGRWVVGGFASRDPEYLRKRSAELLAAAMSAEEGEK